MNARTAQPFGGTDKKRWHEYDEEHQAAWDREFQGLPPLPPVLPPREPNRLRKWLASRRKTPTPLGPLTPPSSGWSNELVQAIRYDAVLHKKTHNESLPSEKFVSLYLPNQTVWPVATDSELATPTPLRSVKGFHQAYGVTKSYRSEWQ